MAGIDGSGSTNRSADTSARANSDNNTRDTSSTDRTKDDVAVADKPTTEAPPNTKERAVKHGDTVRSIAEEEKITVQNLYELNPGIDPAKREVPMDRMQAHWDPEYLQGTPSVNVPDVILADAPGGAVTQPQTLDELPNPSVVLRQPAAEQPLAATASSSLQLPGGVTFSAGQWAGVSMVSVNNPEENQSLRAFSVGGFSLTKENSADGSKTTFTHANADGEASNWSLSIAEGQVTMESQHADGSGSKREYVERGGSRHTLTEAPGWLTASTTVERIGADGNRAVQDTTIYGLTILNVGGTSVTEFDTQGNVTADTAKTSLNAGIPYVAAGSLEALTGSNWGLKAKAELLPLGDVAQQISPNASVESFAGLDVGAQAGVDGFSLAAEGDFAYKGAELDFKLSALRDAMTDAVTTETGISAQVLKTGIGVDLRAGELTDVAGNQLGGYVNGGAELFGLGVSAGTQNTDDEGRRGYVGVTGPLGIEAGVELGGEDGAGLYGDFNGLGNKPDVSEVPAP